jgi:hypothetical protein
MAETNSPPPPLPFASTANVPKDAVKALSENLESELSPLGSREGIQDITSLVGERVFQRLEIHGELGVREGLSAITGDYNQVRQPWVLTCQSWIKEGRYIILRVNPKDVAWRMPQRSVEQKNRIGTILHIWRDRFRGTFYDEPTIAINFQSGNIMPIRRKSLVDSDEKQTLFKMDEKTPKLKKIMDPSGKIVGTKQVGGFEGAEVTRTKKKPDPSEVEATTPEGLYNFYEFLQLVDEQKILDDGSVNYCYIMYNSRIFPNITLAGLFTPEGASWTDSADDPNAVQNWSANFTIYDSYPRLNDLNALDKFFRSAGFGRV